MQSCEIQVRVLLTVLSCQFISDFISADILFYNFLELYLTLSEQIIFFTNFLILTDSHNPLNPLTTKIRYA